MPEEVTSQFALFVTYISLSPYKDQGQIAMLWNRLRQNEGDRLERALLFFNTNGGELCSMQFSTIDVYDKRLRKDICMNCHAALKNLYEQKCWEKGDRKFDCIASLKALEKANVRLAMYETQFYKRQNARSI